MDEIIKKVTDHMEKTVTEDVKNKIKQGLKELVSTEFAELYKRIDSLERTTNKRFNAIETTIDHWKNDLDEDRDNLKGIRLNTANTQAQVNEISSTVDGLPKKIDNAVKDSVASAVTSEVPKAVNDTFEIFGRKVRVIERPTSWIKKLKFWR